MHAYIHIYIVYTHIYDVAIYIPYINLWSSMHACMYMLSFGSKTLLKGSYNGVQTVLRYH